MSETSGQATDLTAADRVELWLMGDDGVRAAEGALRRYRLSPALSDHIATQVVHAAHRMVERGEEIATPAAFARSTLDLRARDLVRSPRGRVRQQAVEELEAQGVGVSPAMGSAATDDLDYLSAEMDLTEIRRHIGRRWHEPHAWRFSASLTYLNVVLDGCRPSDRCPRPVGGAGELDAAHWAGLFYAGEQQCFPAPGQADDATVRQRRSRRIKDVNAVLHAAHRSITGEADHG